MDVNNSLSMFLRNNEEKQLIDETVDDLFSKHYKISNTSEVYTLPKPESMFMAFRWEDPYLMKLKKELNNVKDRLNDYHPSEWKQHTDKRNKAGSVRWYLRKTIDPEFLTQAWCKFYEIASSYELIPEVAMSNGNFTSVHLCEAPGAFVTSLNHWLQLNLPCIEWDWFATTLNPYYEGNTVSQMINDDRLIRHTLDHWHFGADNTGNLMKLENLDALVSTTKIKNNVMLVTADGSIDCMDTPAEQEDIVSQLHYCEAIAALHMLCTGGSFVLKIFTIFEHKTICLIFLLCCAFDVVSIVKPATSKEGNSETYIVCLKFKGQDYIKPYLNVLRKFYENSYDTRSMFHAYDIPHDFLLEIRKCAEFYKIHQCKVILSNIATFKPDVIDDDNDLYLKKLKHAVALKFVKQYKLKRLQNGKSQVVGKSVLTKCHNMELEKLQVYDSYNERRHKQLVQEEAPHLQAMMLENKLKDIKADLVHDQTFKFDIINDLPAKLWINTGKPFRKIHSSRFCTREALTFYNTVIEVAEKIHLKLQFPSEECIKEQLHKVDCGTGYKLLALQFTPAYTDQSIITSLYEHLQTLEVGQSLTLLGYSLLTQLNVALLHLLGNAFEHVEFKIHNHAGYVINLERYVLNKQVLHFFEEIHCAAERAKGNGQIILTAYPVTKLCDLPMHDLIVDLNHWVIKKLYVNSLKCGHHVLNAM